MPKSRIAICLAWLLTAAFVASPQVLARDIYVNNSGGDDRATGYTSQSSANLDGPVMTIAKALRLATSGDRIVIIPTGEPYREAICLRGRHNSGGTLGPLVILGNGATLEGAGEIPESTWKPAGGDVFRFRPTRLGHQQLFIGGRPAVRRPSQPDRGRPELAPLQWCLAQGFLYFRTEPGKSPQQYPLTCSAQQTGITLYQVDDVVISDLIVQGFQLDGIYAPDTASHIRLVGVTCRGNGRSGISVGGASRVELDSCLVGDNGEAQVRTEGFSQTRIYRSELLDNTAPRLLVEGGQVWIDGRPFVPAVR